MNINTKRSPAGFFTASFKLAWIFVSQESSYLSEHMSISHLKTLLFGRY